MRFIRLLDIKLYVHTCSVPWCILIQQPISYLLHLTPEKPYRYTGYTTYSVAKLQLLYFITYANNLNYIR